MDNAIHSAVGNQESGVTVAMIMAFFVTRVQLNGYPSDEQYNRLHAAMQDRGFFRWIRGDDGKAYWLPHAEYVRTANVNIEQIRTDAVAAAESVWNSVEVFVTQAISWAAYGLQEAK